MNVNNISAKNSKKRFNQIYRSNYDIPAWSNNPIPEKIINYLDQLLSNGFLNKSSNILDLGCGRGRFLVFLEKKGFTSAIGVDIAQEAVRLTKPQLKSSQALIADAVKGLPFPDNTFDLVAELTMICSLNPNIWATVYKEIHRVLKKDGYLISEMFIRDKHNSVMNNLTDPLNFKTKTISNSLDQIYGVTTKELQSTFGKHFFVLDTKVSKHKKNRTLDKYYLLGRNRK